MFYHSGIRRVMGTKSAVVLWVRGYVARGNRGNGSNAVGNTAVKM